ncbi:MAG: FAD-dependent oxidoreductase [Gammaproteobacteria bacterium]|nr:FAD-dependent oxidoreductase [Gammaproteobacteria bacterium]
MKTITKCDVAIIGGGISGTALMYLLAKYTDLKSLCLIEKCQDIAILNSHGRNNSQTLHCGDIETNYTLDKAIQVKAAADMVVRYLEKLPEKDQILHKYSKMVLGVGEQECELLRKRFTEFKPHFETLKLFEEEDIAKLEPAVMQGRKEPVVGMGVDNDYTAVNFQALAKSFIEQATGQADKSIDIKLSTKVKRVEKNGQGYHLYTNNGLIDARFVVISAGGHSLLFAQKMGFGKHYSCLPVAGSFYFTPEILKGKVYTIQNDVLPFAAIHGDPDVLVDGKTRFGPTALILPMLERYNYKTIPQFFRVLRPDLKVLKVFWDLFKVGDIRNYIFKNILFEVPILRRWLFLQDARKIVPQMKLADLTYARKFGGIRPVMIDKDNRRLHLGEAKISPGNGIIFNMTPSPGATSCLGNARQDLITIVEYLKCEFKEQELVSDLG